MKRIISGIMIICILFGSVDLSVFASSNFSEDYSYYSGKSVTELYSLVKEGYDSGVFDATNKRLASRLSDLYVRISNYGVSDLVAYYDCISTTQLDDFMIWGDVAVTYQLRQDFDGIHPLIDAFYDKIHNCKYTSGTWKNSAVVKHLIVLYFLGIDFDACGIVYNPSGDNIFTRYNKIKEFFRGRYSTISSDTELVNFFYNNHIFSPDESTVSVSDTIALDVYEFAKQGAGYLTYSTYSPTSISNLLINHSTNSGQVLAAKKLKEVCNSFFAEYGSDCCIKVSVAANTSYSKRPYDASTDESCGSGDWINVVCCKESVYLIQAFSTADPFPYYTYNEKFVRLNRSSIDDSFHSLDNCFAWKTFYCSDTEVYTNIFCSDSSGNKYTPFNSGSKFGTNSSSSYCQGCFNPSERLGDNASSLWNSASFRYVTSDGRDLPFFLTFDALKNYSLSTLLYYVPSSFGNKGTVNSNTSYTTNNTVYNYITNYIENHPDIDLSELQALIDSLAEHIDDIKDSIDDQITVEKSNNKFLKEIRNILSNILALIGASSVDPDPDDPVDDDETSIATFILIFLIFVCLLSLLLKCVGLMFKVMVYITTIFGIPATQGTLPDSFVYGLRVFKGEIPIGGALSSVSNEYAASPLLMELGGVHISFYMLFVILFEIAFIGLTIKAVRKFAEKINFPKI